VHRIREDKSSGGDIKESRKKDEWFLVSKKPPPIEEHPVCITGKPGARDGSMSTPKEKNFRRSSLERR
jgi:hypothetical protein